MCYRLLIMMSKLMMEDPRQSKMIWKQIILGSIALFFLNYHSLIMGLSQCKFTVVRESLLRDFWFCSSCLQGDSGRQLVGAHTFQATSPYWKPSYAMQDHTIVDKSGGRGGTKTTANKNFFWFLISSCCSLTDSKGKIMVLFSVLSRFFDSERSRACFWRKGCLT